jgi:hypothetical protein
MDRINIIRRSMFTFGCGAIGVLPVIGFVPALLALICWGRVIKSSRGQWNPAASYLRAGALLALCGFALTVLAGLVLIQDIYG